MYCFTCIKPEIEVFLVRSGMEKGYCCICKCPRLFGCSLLTRSPTQFSAFSPPTTRNCSKWAKAWLRCHVSGPRPACVFLLECDTSQRLPCQSFVHSWCNQHAVSGLPQIVDSRASLLKSSGRVSHLPLWTFGFSFPELISLELAMVFVVLGLEVTEPTLQTIFSSKVPWVETTWDSELDPSLSGAVQKESDATWPFYPLQDGCY